MARRPTDGGLRFANPPYGCFVWREGHAHDVEIVDCQIADQLQAILLRAA